MFIVGGFCTIAFFVFVLSNVQARISNSGNEIVVQEEAITDQYARMSFPNLSVATSGVLVDRSDTGVFQHMASGTVELTKLVLSCESKSNSTTTIKVGVLTAVDTDNTTQEVQYFAEKTCVTGANNLGVGAGMLESRTEIDFSPARVRASLNRSTTTGFTSDNIERGTNNFPHNKLLRSPAARKISAGDTFAQFQTMPEWGDIVVRIVNVSGSATPTIEAFYRIER